MRSQSLRYRSPFPRPRPCPRHLFLECLEDRLVPTNFLGIPSALTFNGGAFFTGSAVQLTDGVQNEARSFFTNSPYNITQFTTQFQFVQTQVTNPSGGGLTFTIQDTGPTAVGSYQDGLGYAGIGRSVAIKFDLYDNEGEGVNSTGIFTDGRDPTVRQSGLSSSFPDRSVNLNGTGIDLHSQHPFQVTLSYSGSTLSETIQDLRTGVSFTTSYQVNLSSLLGSSTAFVGFTGSTGGFTAAQQIQSWQGAFGPQNNGILNLSSLSPNSVAVDSGSFTLLVNGSGFSSGAEVQWTENGTTTALTPFSITNNQLKVIVPASLLTTGHAGTVLVRVAELTGGSTLLSNTATFTITSSSTGFPILSSLSSNSVVQGSNGFTLFVFGSGFVPGATVRVNGTSLSTSFLSSSELQAVLPASLLMTAGSFPVTVTEFTGQGTVTSSSVLFTVTPVSTNVFPVITSLSPNSIVQGSSVVTLSVIGSGFVPGATIQVNGASLTTSFLSGSELQAVLPVSFLTTAGSLSVSVTEFTAQGSVTSNPVFFTVTPVSTNIIPVINNLNLNSVAQGSSGFTLFVFGSGFVPGATVNLNGTELTTIIASSSELQANVPASLLTSAGSFPVTVTEFTGQGTVTSSSVFFTVTPVSTNVAPVISSLSPNSVVQGSSGFTLFVFGSGFVPGAMVKLHETELTTIYVSSSELQAIVPSSVLTIAAPVLVTVSEFNGQSTVTSNAVTFTVTPSSTSSPIITSLTPESVQEGDRGFTLTVNGSGFVSGATMQWTQNGSTTTLQAVFVSSNQLQVFVPASLLTEESNSIHGVPSIIVVETINGSTVSSNAVNLSIAEAPLSASGGFSFNGVEGQVLTGTVATFVDSGGPQNPNDPGDYNATIEWGDGSTSSGAISLSGDLFSVTGSHSYGQTGTFTISVTIVHESAPPVRVTDTASISLLGKSLDPVSGNGNVLVTLTPSAGVLTITGYNDDIDLTIQPSSSGVLEVAGNGTLVNQSTEPADFALSSISEIDVTLLNGNDTVTLDNISIPGNISVYLGSGTDQLLLSSVAANLISLSAAGPGPDTVRLENATAGAVTMIAGDNANLSLNGINSAGMVMLTAEKNASVSVNNFTATGDLDITLGDNAQTVMVEGSSAANLNLVQTGTKGSPLFDLENDMIAHDLNFTAGDGNNTVVLSQDQVAGYLRLQLGAGQNSLSADHITALFGFLDGGSSGSNTYFDGGGNSDLSVFDFVGHS